MTLIYIHGFLSHSESKVKELSEIFPNATVIGFNYTTNTFDEDLGNMRVSLLDAIERDPETILIGTSFGSLIANYLSQTIPVKTILINPVPFLKDILESKVNIPLKNYATNEDEVVTKELCEFVKNEMKYVNNKNSSLTIIGLEDDVIGDVYEVANMFNNVEFINAGHRISMHDIENLMKRFINTLNI